MEEKEQISSAPCSPMDMNSGEPETLLRLLAQRDAEILQLKTQLVCCQEQLAIAFSENEKLQAKITDFKDAPHQMEKHIDNFKQVSVSVQVPEDTHNKDYVYKPMPEWNDGGDANSVSIADILKETAEGEIENQGRDYSQQLDETKYEESQMSSEYIFDSNSGFYYHPATGYYWDPNSGLFYDYTSGLYYWYNEQTQAYEVHSSVDFQKGSSSSNKVFPTTRSPLKAKSRSKGKLQTNPPTSTLKRRIKRKRLKELKTSVTKMNSAEKSLISEKDVVKEDGLLLEKSDVEIDLITHTNHESDSSESLASGESELVSDLESGELTSSTCTDESDIEIIEDPSTEDQSDFKLPDPEEYTYSEAMAEDYPPCIRFIVQESETLARGDLYIVTCSGGSIGREASIGHALLVPDTSVSKRHAEIMYDYDELCYKIKDIGSQNGTWLNQHRLSQSKKESLNRKLSHDDVLQVGNDTKLLVHIHKGHETCDDCEPGQVQAKLKAQNQIKNTFTVLSKEERRIQQKQELKRIKKKFGLQNSYYESPGAAIKKSGYEDKAMMRRKLVGSENDMGHDENPASVYSPITASNKGHKLLAKMGWKEGEGLGKSNTGIAEPINVELRLNQSAGLGSDVAASLSLDNLHQANKVKRWNQARQRFHKVTAETKESQDSLSQAETPLNSLVVLDPTKAVSSDPGDISSNPSVPNQISSSPSTSASIVNKNSMAKPSDIVWVKGETQQPS